jgi:protease PrsW
MTYLSLFIFAITPSFIWLLYFLKKDNQKESKHLLLFAFSGGVTVALITRSLQILAYPSIPFLIEKFPIFLLSVLFFYHFIIVALNEEFFKYLFVLMIAKTRTDIDEPIDFVIYMITVAMGFAAMENLIYLLSYENIGDMALLSSARFITATLLHALASGILGVFLACRVLLNKKIMMFFGIFIATIIHGMYNIIVIRFGEDKPFSFVILVAFLLGLFLVFSMAIKKVKKMESVCFLEK